ncbi:MULTISPECIES: GNAT family N-acetyltransferase [Kitasatospora]|uniref:GNAT family N-acetyltransferase n=1 Tax=Kitasatospora TaxID=2063 RepID=UPI000A767D8F
MFRDVIGVLTSWDGAGLTVEPRTGGPVRFAEELLVAGKPVPAFPARRAAAPAATPEALQRTASRGWPAVEREQLGEWTLRAAAGFTKRANSVQALGDPGLPLDEALARADAWYAARGLPLHAEVTVPGSPDGLDALLGPAITPTLVRTAPLGALARAGRPADVRLSRTAGPEWLPLYGLADDDPARAAALRVLHGGPSVWFARVEGPDSAPLAIGRAAVDGPWACFSAIETAPAARRRGLATAVMAALAARAAEEGATGAYLQVEADNAGAIALYDGLGFTTSHTYHYARLPQR